MPGNKNNNFKENYRFSILAGYIFFGFLSIFLIGIPPLILFYRWVDKKDKASIMSLQMQRQRQQQQKQATRPLVTTTQPPQLQQQQPTLTTVTTPVPLQRLQPLPQATATIGSSPTLSTTSTQSQSPTKAKSQTEDEHAGSTKVVVTRTSLPQITTEGLNEKIRRHKVLVRGFSNLPFLAQPGRTCSHTGENKQYPGITVFDYEFDRTTRKDKLGSHGEPKTGFPEASFTLYNERCTALFSGCGILVDVDTVPRSTIKVVSDIDLVSGMGGGRKNKLHIDENTGRVIVPAGDHPEYGSDVERVYSGFFRKHVKNAKVDGGGRLVGLNPVTDADLEAVAVGGDKINEIVINYGFDPKVKDRTNNPIPIGLYVHDAKSFISPVLRQLLHDGNEQETEQKTAANRFSEGLRICAVMYMQRRYSEEGINLPIFISRPKEDGNAFFKEWVPSDENYNAIIRDILSDGQLTTDDSTMFSALLTSVVRYWPDNIRNRFIDEYERCDRYDYTKIKSYAFIYKRYPDADSIKKVIFPAGAECRATFE